MTAAEVMAELKANGSDQTKSVLVKHGAREPFFGVKVEFLKKLQKKIKKDHRLALELYNTGNSDAMYFAGMICDPALFSEKDLDDWVEKAYWYYLSEHTVPPVAAAGRFGEKVALKWIKSAKETTASAGWATLSNLIVKEDGYKPDLQLIKTLLGEIAVKLHSSQNRVRYTMNGFIIAAGAFIDELHPLAGEVAVKVGKVKVDMGGTACKVPDALEYIEKSRNRRLSKK